MNARPGTVSRILWHFTGGPPESKKTDEEAYRALKSILETKSLRATAREHVKQRHGGDGVDLVTKEETATVGCVAEIPIQHLGYHAERYGKFAIGFHRLGLYRAGFRPVIYALMDDRELIERLRGDAQLRALTKTIDHHEFETTYAEREWRLARDLSFDWPDVAMVVLPRDYRARLVEGFSVMSTTTPVVAFEDLLQH